MDGSSGRGWGRGGRDKGWRRDKGDYNQRSQNHYDRDGGDRSREKNHHRSYSDNKNKWR